jgi:hypothetical protein
VIDRRLDFLLQHKDKAVETALEQGARQPRNCENANDSRSLSRVSDG